MKKPVTESDFEYNFQPIIKESESKALQYTGLSNRTVISYAEYKNMIATKRKMINSQRKRDRYVSKWATKHYQ